MTNLVELSEDRRHMTIISPDGRKIATLRSAEPGGFTDAHAWQAQVFEFAVTQPGKRTMWRKPFGNWVLYASVQSGPPMWWWPRIKVGQYTLVGWFYWAFEFTIKREKGEQS